MTKIILASASPRRRELLEQAEVSFSVRPSDYEEEMAGHDPAGLVRRLSKGKARQVLETALASDDYFSPEEDGLVIGADTIVVYQGEILGKPHDAGDAVRTLEKLQGRTHQVYTGVTFLYRRAGGTEWESHSFSEHTDVTFYPVSEEEILRYVNSGEPMDKAGSYAVQGKWAVHVKGIAGEYANVVGLPVGRLFYEAKQLGIRLR